MTIQREITGVYLRIVSPVEFIISAVNSQNELVGECEKIPMHKLSMIKNFIDKTNKRRKEMAEEAQKGLFDDIK